MRRNDVSVRGEVTIRPIDFVRDEQPLKAFLTARDKMRLEHCETAVREGDSFVYVADDSGVPVGWAVVHLRYRDDQDWEPDDDTPRFQEGENAYLENIEVTARMRRRGAGARLLEAVQEEAKRHGKRYLWLHTSENNVLAHRLFDRSGWEYQRSVYPQWRDGQRMRIYRKTL
jgi:ribosomal protein S18 acetylase RimI-like enzyme